MCYVNECSHSNEKGVCVFVCVVVSQQTDHSTSCAALYTMVPKQPENSGCYGSRQPGSLQTCFHPSDSVGDFHLANVAPHFLLLHASYL